MAEREIMVPDLGDYADVPVIEVLVSSGQTVAVDDPLIVLESDKATMEVPADVAGTIVAVDLSVGDTVSAGTRIATIDGGGETEAKTSVPEAAEPATAEPSAPPAAAAPPPPSPQTPPAASGDGVVYASPSVRRLAREKGVDLAAVSGSGRKGRITAEDLGAAATGQTAAPVEAAGRQRVPLPRFTRIAGPGLTRNARDIPHITQFEVADVTELEAFRKALNAEKEARVTMVALTMVACAATLKEFPAFNATLDGTDLLMNPRVNIGFAADTPDGLLVPVIPDVDRKGILAVASELRELAGLARDGKIAKEQMEGGTFTISSLGGIGGTHFTPIINAPEVAILGVGRNRMEPEWDGEQFLPRLMMPLSLSYDHRAVDGAAGARFITHLAGVLADFRRVLL